MSYSYVLGNLEVNYFNTPKSCKNKKILSKKQHLKNGVTNNCTK